MIYQTINEHNRHEQWIIITYEVPIISFEHLFISGMKCLPHFS